MKTKIWIYYLSFFNLCTQMYNFPRINIFYLLKNLLVLLFCRLYFSNFYFMYTIIFTSDTNVWRLNFTLISQTYLGPIFRFFMPYFWDLHLKPISDTYVKNMSETYNRNLYPGTLIEIYIFIIGDPYARFISETHIR